MTTHRVIARGHDGRGMLSATFSRRDGYADTSDWHRRLGERQANEWIARPDVGSVEVRVIAGATR